MSLKVSRLKTVSCSPVRMGKLRITSAGNVDGPLKVLLSENNAGCSGFGLRVLFPLPLHPHCWRDKVPLLSPHWQEKWDRMLHIQRHFGILTERGHIFVACKGRDSCILLLKHSY